MVSACLPQAPRALKAPVQIVGHSRQIAQILQQGEQREENGHRGQHHRHHPGQSGVSSVQQHPGEPSRHVGQGEQLPQPLSQPGKHIAQPLGGQVGSCQSQPEEKEQQKRHHRERGVLSGENPVQLSIQGAVPPVQTNGALAGQLFRLPGDSSGDGFPIIHWGAALPLLPEQGLLGGAGGFRPTFQQPQSHPPGVGFLFQQRSQPVHSGFHLLRIAHRGSIPLTWLGRLGGGLSHCLHQLGKPLPRPGGTPHCRDSQQLGKPVQVHLDPFPPGFVQQVDADHHLPSDLQGLERQHQTTLQTGGVTDHHHTVSFAGDQKLPGGPFFPGLRKQGYAPWQVNHIIDSSLVFPAALGGGHGFSGPVACVLPQSGKGVENRAFPHIGSACQGDDPGWSSFHRITLLSTGGAPEWPRHRCPAAR